MMDIREFGNQVKLSQENNIAYKENTEYEYVEVSDIWMYICSMLPLFAGMIDSNILNAIGCYNITWFQLVVIFGAVICVYDLVKLGRMAYSIDNIAFFAVFATPLYLFFRGKVVGHGSWTAWLWLALMMFVCIMAPL